MKLTAVLHTYLNRVWSRDPKGVPALSIAHSGPMTWAVEDQVLSLTVLGGIGSSMTIDLTQYTVASLAAYISAQLGYAARVPSGVMSSLAAIALLDGTGDQSESLLGYTSLRWGILDAIAKELTDAEATAAAAPAQMATVTASGEWLDELGAYLGGNARQADEVDSAYAPRIPATILRPKCNNVAIEIAIESALPGSSATVRDVVVYGPIEPAFDSTSEFNGANNYNAVATVGYGLFDADILYTGDIDKADLSATIRSIVRALKASGTHLRNLNILQPLLADGSGLAVQADGGGTIYAN